MNVQDVLRHVRRGVIGVWFVLLLGHVVAWWPLGAVDWVEYGIRDARDRWINAAHKATPHPSVVILDIDEASLARVGRWPWSRQVLAKTIERAFHPDGANSQGVRSLGVDMLLSEPEVSEGVDEILARTLAHYPVTIGWFLSGKSDATRYGTLPFPAITPDAQMIQEQWPHWYGFTMALPMFDEVSRSGVMNAMFDDDGKVRRVPLLSYFDGQLYESLALSVWRSTLPAHSIKLVSWGSDLSTVDAIEVQSLDKSASALQIPLDGQLSTQLQWRGNGFQRGGGFDYISVADLLDGHVEPGRLTGKVALIGSSAAGLMDLRATPINPAFAGVELHALALASLLDQQFVYQPSIAKGVELLAFFVIALCWWGLRQKSTAWTTVMVVGGMGLSWLGVVHWLYLDRGWLIPSAAPLLLIYGWLVFDMFWGYWMENRQRQHFMDLFGQYVPPQLVSRMAQDPQRYSMAPQSARLSILFSDVRGFTAISESLPPDDLRDYINGYLSAMSEVIERYEGTLDKFIGDAVMAFWGAPVAQSDHMVRAVSAALQMLHTARALSADYERRGWPALKIGIGLNSGEVRVGDMGSRTRRAYTVMGDAVNLASRLEGLCKVYGCALVVSEVIMHECANLIWLELDQVRVKGKELAVTIATPLVSAIDLNNADVIAVCAQVQTHWQSMRQAYVAQHWHEAQARLDQWQSAAHTHAALGVGAPLQVQTLFELYQQRIAHYQKDPPPENWDGVTRHEEK
jgi:adenylate cyclase